MKVTVIKKLPGAWQVNHLSLAEDKLESQFVADELRGEPGVYRGYISDEVEVFDDLGSRRSVIDVRNEKRLDRKKLMDKVKAQHRGESVSYGEFGGFG